jgi:hypothetical protein
MTRIRMSGLTVACACLLGLAATLGGAQGVPPQVRTAELLFKAHAKDICEFAWSTGHYGFYDIKYVGFRTEGADFTLTFAARVDGYFIRQDATFEYRVSAAGALREISCPKSTTIYTAFDVSAAHLAALQEKVGKLRLTEAERQSLPKLNAKGLCELYLQKQ